VVIESGSRVDGDSVQKLKVDCQGKVLRVTEEGKIMFRRYLPFYNPG